MIRFKSFQRMNVDLQKELQRQLTSSIINGFTSLVHYYIKVGAEIPFTSLNRATRLGHLDITKILVEKGSKITDIDVYNASKHGNLLLVRYLIENGGDIRKIDTSKPIMKLFLALFNFYRRRKIRKNLQFLQCYVQKIIVLKELSFIPIIGEQYQDAKKDFDLQTKLCVCGSG